MGGGKVKRVIGLTGGIASGKSTASKILLEKGCSVVDADRIGHEILTVDAVKIRILDTFCCADNIGEIDRTKLGEIVFADPAARSLLNSITHPAIRDEVERKLCEARNTVVLDCALLIEAGFYDMADEIWLVVAEEEARIARIIARNGLSEQAARLRIKAQMPDVQKRVFADRILENNGEFGAFYNAVSEAYRDFIEKAGRP